MLPQVDANVLSTWPAGQAVHRVATEAQAVHELSHAAQISPAALNVPAGHTATQELTLATRYGVAEAAPQLVQDVGPAALQVPQLAAHGWHAVPSEKKPGSHPWRHDAPPGWTRSNPVHAVHVVGPEHAVQPARQGRHWPPLG